MEFPAELRYTETDEWVRVEDGLATVGVTDFAQDQLSDVVYFEAIAQIGDQLAKGEAFGAIESVKAASDLYTPISGKLSEINEALADTPEAVNSDPYGEAWMIKIELSDPAELEQLLDSAAYEKSTKERDH